ncbi:MAG: tyrosine-type recombinase/integrase [Candidatus Dormibacteria bacterium]
MPNLQLVESPEPTPLSRLVEDYLTSCRARGLAPGTITQLSYSLRQVFLPWAVKEGLTSPADLTLRVLERMAAELLTNGGRRGPLSRHTVRTYLRAVNLYLKWAKIEGEQVPDRAAAPLPRLPKTLPQVLSRQQIAAIEAACATERDRLIVRLLADTGMRVGELVALRTGDLLQRSRGSFLRLQGKGERERQVPVMPQLGNRIQRYATKTRPADPGTDRLFVSLRRSSRTGAYEPLTTSGIQQLVRNAAARVGIPQKVHPHLFRHSFVTWAIARGMNPIQLAEIVGHSSTAMIQQVYAHLSPTDAYEAMAAVLLRQDR